MGIDDECCVEVERGGLHHDREERGRVVRDGGGRVARSPRGVATSARHEVQRVTRAAGHVVVAEVVAGADDEAGAARVTHEDVGGSAQRRGVVERELLGLLDAIGADKAVFVGLDFGAVLVWELAIRVPERVESVIVFNNPYLGRAPFRPSDMWRRIARKHFLHLHYFQEPGVADRELAAAPREFLRRVYYALSGDYHYLDVWQHPSEGTGYLDALPESPPLPWDWLSEPEFDVLANSFEKTGFTGGLSWYRALDVNWELTESIHNAPV